MRRFAGLVGVVALVLSGFGQAAGTTGVETGLKPAAPDAAR